MTVGDVIVEALAAHGIDRLFCVPGESHLGLLDACYDRKNLDVVVCHHEAGAGFMALADARLTGLPGVALVSRGPGASNAAIALHTAQQDAVPFLLFVGQVSRKDLRRDAFQEIDYREMFRTVAKWTFELTEPQRTAEILQRALQVATTGAPGPVVIAIPEDVLTAACPNSLVPRAVRAAAAPDRDSAAACSRFLARAARPLAIVGSGVRDEDRAALLEFLERWNIPALVSFRRHDLLPNVHPLYAGDLGLSNPEDQMSVLHEADLILALGTRLNDTTTQGYRFPRLVRPNQTLIHVHADPAVLGKHFSCDLGIACEARQFLHALPRPPHAPLPRLDWIGRLQAELAKLRAVKSFDVDDGVPSELVVDTIGRCLPDDAIVTVDSGSFAAPVYRLIPFRPPQRLLAPISGAMGFGVSAAVAAKLRRPDRPVVCLVGDGGFLMNGSEMAVALERKLPIKVIVAVNGSYGSIRMHQERFYPGRSVGTSFANPDFEVIGKAYGADVTRIDSVEQLECLPRLISSPGIQFIVVSTSLKAVLPKPARAAGGA